MHVLIYEPIFWGGHNLSYVRHLVRTLAELSVRVTVVTGQGAESSLELATHLKPFLDGAQFQTSVPAASAGSDWGKHYYDALVRCIDEHQPDHVLVPTGDVVSGYAGSRRLQGRLKRPRSRPHIECNVLSAFYRANTPWRVRFRSLRASLYASYAPWTHSYTIDQFVSVRHRPWSWIHGKAPDIMPDPVETPIITDRDDARRFLGLPPGDFLVGCVGHFASSDRKNAIPLIQGFLASGLTGARVALIGPMSDAVRRFVAGLRDRQKRVIVIDRLLTASETQTAIAALDLVCVPYRDFYQPSAIVLNAAVLGRPVLASRAGWFQDIIPLFKLGWTADLSTASRIAEALRTYRREWEHFSHGLESRELARFARWQNYAAIFCRHIRERIGLAPDPNELAWDQVIQNVSGRRLDGMPRVVHKNDVGSVPTK